MIVGRIVASLLLLAALGLFAYEIVGAISGGGYDLFAGGKLWHEIHANSLIGFQALIEKNISPWLWGEIVLPILLGPAWATAAVPGLLLALVCRKRRRKQGLR